MIEEILKNPPKIASFDFDETLSMPIYQIPDDYSEYDIDSIPVGISNRIKNLLQALHSAGTTIYLVTSRSDTPENREEVSSFLERNNIYNLFQDMIFTGDDKSHTLEQIGSELHFDDDEFEFHALKKDYPDTNIKFVQIEHPETPGDLRDEENWNFKSLNNLKRVLNKKGYKKESSKIEELIKKWF